MKFSKKVVLEFPQHTWDQPIIYALNTKYDLMFNIIKAKITPRQEGVMTLELSGDKENFDKGIEFLKEVGVRVRFLAGDIERDEELCTHCGLCTVICPTDALSLNRDTMEVSFDKERCVGCELCVPLCPFKAIIMNIPSHSQRNSLQNNRRGNKKP